MRWDRSRVPARPVTCWRRARACTQRTTLSVVTRRPLGELTNPFSSGVGSSRRERPRRYKSSLATLPGGCEFGRRKPMGATGNNRTRQRPFCSALVGRWKGPGERESSDGSRARTKADRCGTCVCVCLYTRITRDNDFYGESPVRPAHDGALRAFEHRALRPPPGRSTTAFNGPRYARHGVPWLGEIRPGARSAPKNRPKR